MTLEFLVEFSEPARNDLREIVRWIAAYDSAGKATALLNKLQAACQRLSTLPARGHAVPEIHSLVQGFLESHEGPYRIIYHIEGQTVFIDALLDGRRNLQELLERRLLGQ